MAPSDLSPNDRVFLMRANALVTENLADERFGVSELADKMHMSRSNLLRRFKQSTGMSASQFIRDVRLKKGMALLNESSLSVSEVAHQVGFGGASYFIKCFREYYGYPPGEVGRQKKVSETSDAEAPVPAPRKFWPWAIIAGILMVVGFMIYWVSRSARAPFEKAIAVLPFKNDSGDSTNVYLINGIMESTLNNLQKINNLRVVSRTSSEKYRNAIKSIPELAGELNVRYVVEGSGQKVDNRILLNIQLIDAPSDRPLWARQYEREVTDIFQLQQEIAKDIASEIQAIVTWEEEKRIEKIPTTDLVAYDLFLKAGELMRQGGTKNLTQAITHLRLAIERDQEFALAYAATAISFYYLDAFQVHKQHAKELGEYADKALLLDPTQPESLFAKGLYYVHQKAYESAVPYLEKALEYNPNSILIIHFLADFYSGYLPNTAKYLEYALQGVRLDATGYDSTTSSYNYLHLSNALVQTGFVDESLRYIERSLAYDPNNPYAGWVRAVVVYAKDGNPTQAEKLLLAELAKDSTRLYILQELGKLYFHIGNDQASFRYYQRFVKLREAHQLDLFPTADLTIGTLYARMGMRQEADNYLARFKAFADRDQSIYKHMHLAMYELYRKDIRRVIAHLRQFAKEDHYQYWILLFKNDPMLAPYKNNAAFKRVFAEIEVKFWNENKEIQKTLEEKGLL